MQHLISITASTYGYPVSLVSVFQLSFSARAVATWRSGRAVCLPTDSSLAEKYAGSFTVLTQTGCCAVASIANSSLPDLRDKTEFGSVIICASPVCWVP
jgi:hypothetical protein